MSKTIYIGGRLESKEKGNVVTGANAILDDTKGKKQNVINKETDDELLRLEQSKQDNLNFDNAPTENSTNPVTSGGVYTAEKALSDAIEAILLLIPSAATALNKLVDTNTMNSSISTATATFRGTYNAVSDLGLTYQATHAQIEAALDALGLTADNNDFVFVQIPVSDQSQDIAKTERFKFNGTNWLYEYDLNTSGFTAVQWAAINSGITAALVTKLTDLPTAAALQLALNAKQDTLTFDNEPTALSQNPVTSGGIYTAIQAVATALSDYSTTTDGRLNILEGLIPTEASSSNKLTDKAYVDGLIQAITELIPAEADTTNQLADKAYVLAQILAATPAFKGQFTTLAELQAVASPKAGDLGIVRTKDSDGMDVFTVYQYLSNAWNVFYSLSYHPQTKPATTGTTGDYPYNGMGRVELPMNIVGGVNTLTQSMMPTATGGNTVYVIKYDFTLGEDITVPANCVLEFDGGSINNGNIIISSNSRVIGKGEENTNLCIKLSNNTTNVVIDGVCFKSTNRSACAITTTIDNYTQNRTYNVTISNCVISGYLCGINVNGTNLSIVDNILFNNGNTPITDSYIDICAGYIQGGDASQIINPNIIVSRNKCLSGKVHRNIDCGELYGETNILITDNICVSMTDDGKSEVPVDISGDYSAYKKDCIMVGYTGTSQNNRKYVTITGNVCKYSNWSGIYVRANNTPETEETSKYIANISNNTIVGILKFADLPSGIAYHGAIGVELMSGSIISGNIIKDCTGGIDLGNIYGKGETVVTNNTIDTSDYGIITDSSAEKLNIKNNDIKSSSCVGISSVPASTYDYSSYASINDNIMKPSSYGIRSTGTGLPKNISIHSNNITLQNTNAVGIEVQPSNDGYASVLGNTICGIDSVGGKGIIEQSQQRGTNYLCRNNTIKNCSVGHGITNGNDYHIHEDMNVYINCTAKYNHSCVGNGVFLSNGCIDMEVEYAQSEWCFSAYKAFVIGDTIRTNTTLNIYRDFVPFSMAICTKSTEINNGSIVANTAKWSFVNLEVYQKSELPSTQINAGQEAYINSEDRYVRYTGTKWVDRITGADA